MENLNIDDALEKKAVENNLSVVNVKSILHVSLQAIKQGIVLFKLIAHFER